jgi:hypothetical protein
VPKSAVSDCTQLEQVDRAVEECFQRLFQVQKVLEARRNGWVKLHEDIDVAFIFLEVPALN